MNNPNNLESGSDSLETRENGFLYIEPRNKVTELLTFLRVGTRNKVDELMAIENIPVWAKDDILIGHLVKAKIGRFVICKSLWDSYIDENKPPFHRWFIYFDGKKYYIKRWKIIYISWAPIKWASWFDIQEEFEINKEEYKKYSWLSKEEFLNKENEK